MLIFSDIVIIPCVCVCIRGHVCMRACSYACLTSQAYIRVCVCGCTCVQICILGYKRDCVVSFVCLYLGSCVRLHMCAFTRVCTLVRAFVYVTIQTLPTTILLLDNSTRESSLNSPWQPSRVLYNTSPNMNLY